MTTESDGQNPTCQVGGMVDGGHLTFGANDGSSMFDRTPCGQPSVAQVSLFIGRIIHVNMCERHVKMAQRLKAEQ